MDFTWLILFILILIISSVLSKRKERAEAEKRERREGLDPTERREASRHIPSSPGAPVAPGPFGPILTPKPSRPPEPEPAAAADRTPPPAPSETPASPSAGRSVFDEMRADLARRQREQARERRRMEMPPEMHREAARPIERPMMPTFSQPQLPARHMPSPPKPAEDGGSTTKRIVDNVVHTRRAAPARRKRGRLRFDKEGARRGIIMAEILNKPVTMRSEAEPWNSF